MKRPANSKSNRRLTPNSLMVLRRRFAGPGAANKIPPGQLTPQVLAALGRMADEVDRLNQKLTKVENRCSTLAALADRDPLLSMFNRRAFERELWRTAAYVERYGVAACLVFIDMNKFKWINDVYGHAAGDTVLRHVAQLIAHNTRQTDIIGRLGGDEFAVILSQTSGEMGVRKAERIEAIIATTPVDLDGTTVLLTASAGVADITGTGDLAALMERADASMYQRKEIYHASDRR
ncbi:MAG: GGDEF domain-containing protein [Alphaproteobacteria bacterium]